MDVDGNFAETSRYSVLTLLQLPRPARRIRRGEKGASIGSSHQSVPPPNTWSWE